jgi:hypothetical protein
MLMGNKMIDLNDTKWETMHGAYKSPYNPIHIIKILEEDIFSIEAWDLIWENLHHQGDIGEASYAIIPLLVELHKKEKSTDWQLYSYTALIIQESHRKTNPKIPEWLEVYFSKSLSDLFAMAISDLKEFKDEIWVRAIVGFILMYKDFIKYGAIISSLDKSEIDEFVEKYFSWKEIYE